MGVQIEIFSDTFAELTTDNAASSYNMPVLVFNGIAYGPGDKLPLGEFAEWLGDNDAKTCVFNFWRLNQADIAALPIDQYNMVAKFCGEPLSTKKHD